jgi:hypothetical protein
MRSRSSAAFILFCSVLTPQLSHATTPGMAGGGGAGGGTAVPYPESTPRGLISRRFTEGHQFANPLNPVALKHLLTGGHTETNARITASFLEGMTGERLKGISLLPETSPVPAMSYPPMPEFIAQALPELQEKPIAVFSATDPTGQKVRIELQRQYDIPFQTDVETRLVNHYLVTRHAQQLQKVALGGVMDLERLMILQFSDSADAEKKQSPAGPISMYQQFHSTSRLEKGIAPESLGHFASLIKIDVSGYSEDMHEPGSPQGMWRDFFKNPQEKRNPDPRAYTLPIPLNAELNTAYELMVLQNLLHLL